MKVLYCNPSFWEYRLPFYVELNRLFNGNFHVLYSTRYFMSKHRKLLDEIKKELGDNAHPYDNETVFDFKTRSFSKHQEGDKSIPIPTALWGMVSKIKPDVLITEGFFQWTPIIQLYGLVHHVPVLWDMNVLCTQKETILNLRHSQEKSRISYSEVIW